MELSDDVPLYHFSDDDDHLPKIRPVIRVNKKEIFESAAQKLKLTIDEEVTDDFDEDMHVTKIQIGNIMCKETYQKGIKKFSGKPAPTKKMSIQNAYTAALSYLEDAKLITVDDYNATNVSHLKDELFRAESWSMLFEYKTKKLADIARARDEKLHTFLCSFESLCQSISADSMPPAMNKPSSLGVEDAFLNDAPPAKKQRCPCLPHSSIEDSAMNKASMFRSLANLRAQLLDVLGDNHQKK